MLTRRCTQRQFLLRPDDDTNNAFVYCLALAAERTAVDVVAFIANSNHHHTVVVDREGRLPEFLEHFHKMLAKHQNALRGRWENMWSSEQASVVELVGPEDVLAKVIYTLANPVKDHLVERVRHWPGASSIQATVNGRVLVARRPHRFFRSEGPTPATVALSCRRPPGWEQLSFEDFRRMVITKLVEVERAAAAERDRRGTRVLGRKNVLRQSPTARPLSSEPRRELDPRIAARDKWPRVEAISALKAFRRAYREARERWQACKDTVFPEGTWWVRRFAGALCSSCGP